MMVNTTNGVYVMSGHSNRSLNLMTVPELYAFVCKRPYTISMKVKLYKFEDEEGMYLINIESEKWLSKFSCKLLLNFLGISEQSLSEFVLDESSLSANFGKFRAGWESQWVIVFLE